MTNFKHVAQKLMRDLRAQDMVEYALMAASFAVSIGAFFPTSIAPNISAIFSRVVTTLNLAP
jgi:hypothetical protein